MYSTTLPIATQISILEELIQKASEDAVNVSEGILVIGNRGNYTEWFIKRKDSRIYLPKKEIVTAQRLAQSAYSKMFLKQAEKLLKELRRIEKAGGERSALYLYHGLAKPYEKLCGDRKKLTKAYVLPDDEYIKTWTQEKYPQKEFLPDTAEIYSERGERVRSKSEKMLADKLFLMGIPYRYEWTRTIPGMGTVSPDFTLLDVKERRTIIHEHFGMMDDPEYARNAFWKLDHYERAGYRMGIDLLCTFESGNYILDMKCFERILRERLL